MNKYKRIEVNAFRRRVAIVSGEWPQDTSQSLLKADEGVSLEDSNSDEHVAPESPEGQMILIEAIRSLERRLSPEARATILLNENSLLIAPKPKLVRQLRRFHTSVFARILRFGRKEK